MIKSLVSLLKFKADGSYTLMCNAALVRNRGVLAVSRCAQEIAKSGNLNRYRVRVAEGLDELYFATLKHIDCVDYDSRHENELANQLAWIVVSTSFNTFGILLFALQPLKIIKYF